MSKGEGSSKERVSKEKDASIELMRKINEIYKSSKNAKKLEKIGINSPEEALERCMTMHEFIAQKNGKGNLVLKKDSSLDEILAFEGQNDNGDKMIEFFGTKKAQLKGHIADEIFEKNGFGKIKLDPNVVEKLGEGKIDPNEIKDFSDEDLARLCGRDGIELTKKGLIKEYNKENGNEKEGEELQEDSNVKSACQEFGIESEYVDGYAVVNSNNLASAINENDEFSKKYDRIRENEGDVTVIRVKTPYASGPDLYYAMQNGRPVLFGYCVNINKDLEEIFGSRPNTIRDMGKDNYRVERGYIRENEEKDISYTEDGISVSFNPRFGTSRTEKDTYKIEMKKLIDEYVDEMTQAFEENDVEEISKVNEKFYGKAKELARDNDISEHDATKTMNDAEESARQIGDDASGERRRSH